MNAQELRQIVGQTTLTDEQLLDAAEYFEKKAGKINGAMVKYFREHCENKARHMAPKPKFEEAMYANDGRLTGRNTNDQGEP